MINVLTVKQTSREIHTHVHGDYCPTSVTEDNYWLINHLHCPQKNALVSNSPFVLYMFATTESCYLSNCVFL